MIRLRIASMIAASSLISAGPGTSSSCAKSPCDTARTLSVSDDTGVSTVRRISTAVRSAATTTRASATPIDHVATAARDRSSSAVLSCSRVIPACSGDMSPRAWSSSRRASSLPSGSAAAPRGPPGPSATLSAYSVRHACESASALSSRRMTSSLSGTPDSRRRIVAADRDSRRTAARYSARAASPPFRT